MRADNYGFFHDSAAGDFLLMSRRVVHSIRGYPEIPTNIMIDGTAMIRDINKQLHWDLPMGGPKTLNGLILEMLETIPDPGTSMRIGRFTVEIMQIADNAVKTVRIIEQIDATEFADNG